MSNVLRNMVVHPILHMLFEQTGYVKGLLVRRNLFCQKHFARSDNLWGLFLMYLILIMRGAKTASPIWHYKRKNTTPTLEWQQCSTWSQRGHNNFILLLNKFNTFGGHDTIVSLPPPLVQLDMHKRQGNIITPI